jgi:uncharacterized SAM-binding protein YcdF (DUF218 family)
MLPPMASLSALLCLLGLPLAVVAAIRRGAKLRPASPSVWLMVVLAVTLALLATHDFLARKLMIEAIKPVGLIWLWLWTWMVCEWQAAPRHRLRLASVSGLFMLLSVLGNGQVAGMMEACLVAQVAGEDPATMAACDAVCVLGGATSRSADGRPQMGTGADRLTTAVRLWRLGKAPILVTSGPYDLPGDTGRLWSSLGVPDDAIIRLTGPLVTGDEIAAYADLIALRHWRRVGLLTSSWHMPRAMSLVARHGFAMVPIACDLPGEHPAFNCLQLLPSAEALETSGMAMKERLGMALGQ